MSVLLVVYFLKCIHIIIIICIRKRWLQTFAALPGYRTYRSHCENSEFHDLNLPSISTRRELENSPVGVVQYISAVPLKFHA